MFGGDRLRRTPPLQLAVSVFPEFRVLESTLAFCHGALRWLHFTAGQVIFGTTYNIMLLVPARRRDFDRALGLLIPARMGRPSRVFDRGPRQGLRSSGLFPDPQVRT
jgi:hypothetical protein